MMDPSEIDNFEDQWRKALKEASEAPPQSVWEGIEARLDQQEDKGMILPLWWKSGKMWYAAASIAALLVVGGVWYSNSEKGNKINAEIAVKQSAEDAEDKVNTESNVPNNEAEVNADGKQEQLALQNKKAEANKADQKPAIGEDNQTLAFEKSSKDGSTSVNVNKSDARGSVAAAKIREDQPLQDPNADLAKTAKPTLNATESTGNINSGNDNYAAAKSESNVEAAKIAAANPESTLALLAAQPYSGLDVHMQKRYVFFRPDAKAVDAVEPEAPAKNKEYYAALSLMPASFNPNLKVKEAPAAFATQGFSTRKAVTGTSESGASYAVQTQGGMKISKHWSVEMGISYLKGNSSYEGGGYVLNAYTNRSANVVENALAGLAPGPVGVSNDKNGYNNGALYIDVAKTVSNNYQYLQLPVQAGFTLYPEKKLSYSLLGGVMANFFLSNELESASGEIITTKASDEIYRSMNWAATTGLRFNYRLSTRWNANLTGSYQKSVTSGFRSNQSLDSRPYLYGVSWGMRYSF